MARIGIYGGTFNPVHKTHIEIGKIAFSQLNLDMLIFLISGEPPHKDSAENVLTFQRLEMLQLALADEENFEIDTREIYRSGKSYSYLTLQEYKVEFPDDELYFIMGSDSILQFQNWVNPNIITELATVAVVLRAGDDIAEVKECLTNLENLYNKEFILLDFKPNDFASSTVRKNLDDNQVLNNQLSTNVIEYIKEHNPYGKVYSMDCISDIDSKVKKVLKTSRYTHTLGVANICYALAIKWAYPANNAYLAGLLHDCAKCISDSERLSVCKKNDISITPIEKKYPHLLHGKVGAFYCTHKYGIDDNIFTVTNNLTKLRMRFQFIQQAVQI